MLRLVDRYLLREMVFPFVLAGAGFVLYFVLNLGWQLSDFMLDRNISFWVLLQLLIYRLPELLVYGLPVGVLFAIFWALGRLSHDRELVALQAAGFSLRRLMWPVLLMGLITTIVAFAIGELWTPWANHQYYNLLREIFFMRSAPQIRESTFFKISENAYAYVERYDPELKTLQNVMIFDKGGAEYLNELSGRFPKIIAAETGLWDGEYWRLKDGKIHKLRDDGQFEYTATFETLSLRAGPYLERLFIEQRTPQEMSLRELAAQIKLLQDSKLSADSLLVEYHTKLAVPLSAVIFALFGAPLSLIFAQGGAPRGRAAGVIISVILVACYQGLLIWMMTLGKRSIVPAMLAPWVPNILFGVIGVLLLYWLDRLSRLDLFARLRRLVPLALALWALGNSCGVAQEPPPISLEIQADTLTVARDWSQVMAEGHVRLEYEKGRLEAEKMSAQRLREGQAWTIQAQGTARWEGEGLKGETEALEIQIEWDGQNWQLQNARLLKAHLEYDKGALHADEIFLSRTEKNWQAQARGQVRLEERKDGKTLDYTDADELTLELEDLPPNPFPEGKGKSSPPALGERSWVRARRATLKNFTGQTRFESPKKTKETLRFQGREAVATFGEDGRIRLLEISNGEITTCTCGTISCSDYSISAATVRLELDESVLATNILLKTYGVPVFWAPVYFASLKKEETKNPLLPDFGQLPARGWYLRWRFPFVIDKNNTGTLLIDYYTRLPEVGTGIDYNYNFWSQQGKISLYRLVGRGESWAIDWNHQSELPLSLNLALGVSGRSGLLQKEVQRLFSRATLSANWGPVRWTAAWSREQNLQQPKPEEEPKILYRFLERAPELTLSLAPWRLGPLPFSVTSSASWGRYREKKLDRETLDESARFDASVGLQSLALGTDYITLQASTNFRLSLYEPQQYRRDAYDLTVALIVRPLPGLNADVTYSYRRVLGQSPFSFDQLSVLHRLSARASWATLPFNPNLTTGYDLETKRFDPLRLTLTQKFERLTTNFDIEYDLNQHFWQRTAVQLSGTFALHPALTPAFGSEGLSFQLSTAYLFPKKAFEDLILKLSWGAHRLGLSFDLNYFRLKRLNGETSWQWGPDWEFSFKGEYDLPSQRFRTLQLGVIRKFCNACWQVGLYSDSQRFWLQAQINAFPTAQVRYSPTDQRLSFGEDK